MAPVYWGLQDVEKPLHKYGEKIGEIPQVERTYTYFHSGYSQMNEHQLAIGESTTSQRKELHVDRKKGKQIITIEQAMVFALQRCKKAEDAVTLIAGLVEKYGFLPSCYQGSETLCIADPNEAWIFEVCSVGEEWTPESGKPGALWVAQRVPDDHVLVVPNWSIIKEIDEADKKNFRYSSNYKTFAIEKGWYKPENGKPFVWQDVYSPMPREWATSRFWLFYSKFAKHLKGIPPRDLSNPYKGYDSYHQYVEPLSTYPVSAKPDKKLSVQDVIAFQREVFKGTIYDMTADKDWLIPGKDGKLKKSPLTTPFPTKDMRELLDITHRRNVSRGGYGMVAQLRSWLPDAIGGVYWFFVDNQYTSTYVPIYAGVQEISPLYKNYNPKAYSPKSARWAVDFVDNLLYLRWQHAYKDLLEVRTPVEEGFFKEQKDIDAKASALYKKSPKKAKKFLTDYTRRQMEKVVEMYNKLRDRLITKYTNNNLGS